MYLYKCWELMWEQNREIRQTSCGYVAIPTSDNACIRNLTV